MSPLTHHLAGDTSPYSHLRSYVSLPDPPHPGVIMCHSPLSAPVGLSYDCPSNLKEAIDWILRVTGKDTVSSGDNNGTAGLAKAVQELITKAGIEQLKPPIKIGETLIENLATGLAKFIGYGHNGIRSNNYKSAYDGGATWQNSQSNEGAQTCAKIFLGCVPLCFYGLSYLYWRCSENGAWKKMKLNDRDGSALKNFMAGMGYGSGDLDGRKQGEYVAEALKGFNSFQSAINGVQSFIDFFKKLWPSQSSLNTNSHPLSAVFLCASAYFQHQRTTKPTQSPQPPSSIRSMLYWLSALIAHPQFESLLDHFSAAVPPEFKVAISGSGGGVGLQTLSPDDLAGNLITSCLSSSWVLGTIQGPGETDTPLLHEIYCSSALSYPPSGPALLNSLSNYSYALQFQLLFLFQQCSRSTIYGCAWQDCMYGSGVQPHSDSYICPGQCNNSHTSGTHDRNCLHNTCANSPLQAFLTDKLQGFRLPNHTNNIVYINEHMANHPAGSMCHVKMGFSLQQIAVANKKGSDIQKPLRPLCGSDISPLRQLCEKLSCLTKRTPRSLGDIFGFYAQLIDQLFSSRLTMVQLVGNIIASLKTSNESSNFNNDIYAALTHIENKVEERKSQSEHQHHSHLQPPSGLAKSLLSIYNEIPFWFQLFMADGSRDLALTLFDLRQQCHKAGKSNEIKHTDSSDSSHAKHSCSQRPGDLWSLSSKVTDPTKHQVCASKDCGGYLFPLSYSRGATFSPKFATTYLSWVLYLAEDLHNGLRELLVEFKAVKCGLDSVGHYQSGNCSCHSVVQCGGVLPLLYTNGFNFDTTTLLNGWTKQSGGIKWKHDTSITRTCQKFHSALSNVLADNAPLHNLLLAIDEFLYHVRFRFMSMVSSFWLCSLLVLFYFIFYGIDVLHLQSHVHFPTSHRIPPIALLTTGKAPALTKLTYYMP
ncbi:variant erythrocyte surface antigen-1 family protein [Babesia caballi]|uniref:Variant erythrocyte surface antigen-1 family protein n=1 Tax=Babesia caballi TaxID=5871 RepID=A0AAV4LM89_BABCB|nr:variant erythrocyte surface antigen-1 family protein [Babesia caballi]